MFSILSFMRTYFPPSRKSHYVVAAGQLIPILLLLGCQQCAVADSPSELNQKIAGTRAVKEGVLSPDGNTVASIITESTLAGGRSNLWRLSKTTPPKQLTKTDEAVDVSEPRWSADGRSILFLEKNGATAAIKRINVDSGSSDTLTFDDRGSDVSATWEAIPAGEVLVAKGFALSRSDFLAVWATRASNTAAKTARKDDSHVFDEAETVRLYVIDNHGTRTIELPDPVRSVAWGSNNRSLLVVTEPASDDLGAQNRLWLIDGEATPREIRGTAQDVQSASWLPDGRFAYFARCNRNAPTVCLDLYVQALDGSPPRNLTDGLDGSLIMGIATQGPVVTRSGDVLLTIAHRFEQRLGRVSPAIGRIHWIDSAPAVVKIITSNLRETGFALLAANRGGIVSVYLADSRLSTFAHLASPQLQPVEWQPLKANRLEWVSDDQTVDALLYLPNGAVPPPPYPLVVDVHGGPAGRFDDTDYPLVRLLLAKGWAVLHVNPRGSFGYGAEILASVQDDLGGADYRDIMSGVDAALTQAPLDKEKLAMIGFSYGATISSFALGRTNRFKGLVAAAPVTDQISEYGTESSSWYDRWYFGQPWKRLEAAWRQSPLSEVEKAMTPLLLLQGESDPIDPPGQSFELYRALRQHGSPVELVLFPRETHRELGQNYFGFPSVEPHHGIVLRQRMVDFLSDAFAGKPNAGLKGDARP